MQGGGTGFHPQSDGGGGGKFAKSLHRDERLAKRQPGLSLSLSLLHNFTDQREVSSGLGQNISHVGSGGGAALL